eukprot:gene14905-20048_t
MIEISTKSTSVTSLDNVIINEFQPEIHSLHEVFDVAIPFLLYAFISMVLSTKESFGIHACNIKIDISYQVLATEFACFIAILANLITTVVNIVALISSKNLSKRPLLKLYGTSIIINVITILSVSYHWFLSMKSDSICVDAMGVPSFMIQWCEWLVLVPFLTYLACMIDKPKFNKKDQSAIVCAMIMVIFGCISAMVGSNGFSTLSICFYLLGMICFVMKIRYIFSNDLVSFSIVSNDMSNEIQKLVTESKSQRGFILSCSYLLFPLVHFLSWSRILSLDDSLCAFLFLSTFVKLGLNSVFIQSHMTFSSNVAKCTSIEKTNIIDEQIKLNSQNEYELKILNEFRNMLGNAAHDLKTPLVGFGGAIDNIEQDMVDALTISNGIKDNKYLSFEQVLPRIIQLENHLTSIKETIDDIKHKLSIKINENKSNPIFEEKGKLHSPIRRRKKYVTQINDNNSIVHLKYKQDNNNNNNNNEKSVSVNHMEIDSNFDVKRLNILLVDDSDMIRKVVSKKLLQVGHYVDFAENGSVAVNKVIKNMEILYDNYNDNKLDNDNEEIMVKPYDVIIMDLQMPVMDGLEATNRIREYEKSFLNKIKLEKYDQNYMKSIQNYHFIIGCSANIESSKSYDQLYPGMDFLMEKPFNIDKFNSAMTFLNA